MAWSDEARVLLHHVSGQVGVHHLPEKHTAPGCTRGRKQTGRDGVMLEPVFRWEKPGVLPTMLTSPLSTVTDQVHPFIETIL